MHSKGIKGLATFWRAFGCTLKIALLVLPLNGCCNYLKEVWCLNRVLNNVFCKTSESLFINV